MYSYGKHKYGFELEGFAIDETGTVILPPTGMPTDGFPGLVEARTVGGADLEDAYFSLLRNIHDIWKVGSVSFWLHEHTFSAQEKRLLRQRPHTKDVVYVRSLYDKKPRALGNKTIASLQINVSYLLRAGYSVSGKKGAEHRIAATYGLLDIPKIVRALDVEFAKEIRDSGRQPGEYCLKEDRLEYRSLPNFVFAPGVITYADKFLSRIRNAVEK